MVSKWYLLSVLSCNYSVIDVEIIHVGASLLLFFWYNVNMYTVKIGLPAAEHDGSLYWSIEFKQIYCNRQTG